MLRKTHRRLLPFFLLAISLRVLTGAAEAQVNFISLVTQSSTQEESILSKTKSGDSLAFNSAEHANPIPDKKRSSATYKKYLTPENSNVVAEPATSRIENSSDLISYQKIIFKVSPIWVLRANAPPKASLSATPSHTLKTYSFISWESEFGTSTINNGAGRIRSI